MRRSCRRATFPERSSLEVRHLRSIRSAELTGPVIGSYQPTHATSDVSIVLTQTAVYIC